jgi:topoisomerase-4 subunit B
MSDLFSLVSNKKKSETTSYSAKDIEVLEGLEPVRKRPGMYIGGTDINALHHLISEVLDNSMDEAVAGFATIIKVKLCKDNYVIISDNGRGIPVDNHPKFPDKSALEVILTELHSGGKFSNNAYQTAGGLHGVGICVVNALSDFLEISVYKQGICYTQTYSKGHKTSDLIQAPCAKNAKGTMVKFHPDKEIFDDITFSPKKIYDNAKSKAYLYQGVTIEWECEIDDEKVPKKSLIHFPNGLKDYLNSKLLPSDMVIEKIFSGNVSFDNNNVKLEWALAWNNKNDGSIQSYCNTIPTPLGGTHETGFKTALLRSIKSFGEMINNKKSSIITIEDILISSDIVLSLFISDPSFQGQTKERLVSPHVTKIVDNIIKDHLDNWLISDKTMTIILLDYIIAIAEFRISRKSEKNISRKNIIQKLRLPGKLSDCTRTTKEDTELFIVEGDSAGGTAKQARDRETQAILPIRGKILNVANSTMDKIAANQEIRDLETALACGSLKHYKEENLRYDKIIIMTDADVDGAHIASLLMTFFYLRMPDLIKNGHLYIAKPPLFRLMQNNKTYYAVDEENKTSLIDELSKQSKAKIEIGRFKGLGEMMPIQLKETTMNKKNRSILQITIENFENTTEIVDNLMGKKPEKRFEFIYNQALNKMDNIIHNLDI